MSLYKDASLAMIPSAYKDGKLYSIRPTDGDGDFTFSRGSNLAATRVDVNGLIEKGRENLLLQSNSFSTSPWESNQANREAVVSSGESGYDGTNDAWLVLDTTGSGLHQITGETFSLSGIYSASVYAKAYTNSRYLGMAGFGLAGGNEMPVFDLVNGTIDMPSTSSILKDATITSVGNGWYRCSMMFSYSGSSSFSITLCNSATNNGLSGYTYTGTGSNGFYIQDAQLEQGLVATDYIETGATTAQAGILEDMPRLDYSGSCPSLLLEPQRSNLVTQSEYFESSDWTFKPDVLLDFGYEAPDGTNTAYKITDNGANAHIASNFSSSIVSGVHKSIWAKTTSGTGKVNLLNHNNDTNALFTITNEWQRFDISHADANFFYAVDFRASGATLSEVLIWGAQAEVGSYPTSYIPTYGSSVTRSKDTGSLNLVGAGINDGWTSGTILIEFEKPYNNENVDAIRIHGNSVTGRAYIYNNGYGFASDWGYASNFTTGANTKIIYRLNTLSTANLFKNGVKVTGAEGSGTAWSDIKYIYLNNQGGAKINIKQIVVFPTALTDSECIALTE